jgi:magnesium transporter
VHYLELDQVIGEDYLVTVHGPISSKAPLEAALRETEAVKARMDSGRLRRTSPFGLSYAIVSSTHELITAGMLIMAGGGNGKPLD